VGEGVAMMDGRSYLLLAAGAEEGQTVSRIATLSTRGPIFLAGGQPWRWKGVTAFGLLNRFARGEDIGPFLADFAGFNILRVWPYVEWGATGWDSPPPDVTVAFLRRCAAAGFYVELTLLTDDAPRRIDEARELVAVLTGAKPTNLVLEIGNEPTTHKAIYTPALKDVCEASGFLYSSGDYEDSRRFFGSFLTTHTARDGEWPRRAHDLVEFYHGGGPNDPSDPPHPVPIVADEPIRPDQAGFNDADFRAYFAAVSLLGAGGTFHFESGKYGQRPTPDERRIAAVVLDALNAYPADAPLGAYTRPVENSLRTYIVGAHMARVRPTGPPPAGWQCDASGIVCHR
jgi:hypothetical protein